MKTLKNTQAYEQMGIKIIRTSPSNGHIDLNELMTKLGEEKIDSILLEGGGELNFSALQSGIVNRIQAYISPKILGGKSAPSPVGGMGFDSPDSGIILCSPEITYFGNDILIEWKVTKCSQE